MVAVHVREDTLDKLDVVDRLGPDWTPHEPSGTGLGATLRNGWTLTGHVLDVIWELLSREMR
jgi:hypothetical protein